ncbi:MULTISPECIES: TetR/AcrR family transcriptional regulator [unclassified Sphingomonas]|uniref:TetR/AcrR family transcriptional regulator n=1 Tax=unclassified Sphingomonas TaxID=196159 RepID=UPI000830657E|nr:MULTISPECIES: TetR/AcrR family transcriptional regulator [unclassified Sphingomonas]
MARAFTEEDRALARQILLAEGRRLFVEGGLKAVSLSSLSHAAGIAKTSFYAFFSSKEVLILDLLAAEAEGVTDRVMTPLSDPALSAAQALSTFLHALLAEYETNPFLARLASEPHSLAAIAKRVRPDDLQQKAAWMERPLATFFAERTNSGEICTHSIETLIDVVRSVSLLAVHRDRFDSPQRFQAAAATLIDAVSQGLTRREAHS